MNEVDFTKRCPCAVQFTVGPNKGKWSPDHIHTINNTHYYCGECGKNRLISEAIIND